MPFPDDNNLTSLARLKRWLEPKPSGGIASVEMTDNGAGYTLATGTVVDASGTGAVLSPIIVGGVIAGWTVDIAGEKYVDPTLVITGDGAGASGVAHVKDDDALAQLITDVSQAVLYEANIARFYDDGTDISETRNGNGSDMLMPLVRPVNRVSAVMIGSGSAAVSIPPSTNGGAGFLFDDSIIYLVGHRFPRGPQNVTIVYQAGAAPNSQRAANAERAVIATATLWWKRRADAHLTNISAPQGMGVSTGINTRDFPTEALSIIQSLRVVANQLE